MKKIMITGETGYIARNLKDWLISKGFDAECVSVRNGPPPNLSCYDAVVHCAALVHRRCRRADCYKINTDLTRQLALMYKRSGGGLFVFISTMSVYGKIGSIESNDTITKETPARPSCHYGMSKLLAERALLELEDASLRVAIIRPPMVYGKGCPGNFRLLERIARITPLFPYINNKRSMLHIKRLCGIIFTIINEDKRGFFYPQDARYHCTSQLVRKMAKSHGRKVLLSTTLGRLVMLSNISVVKKAFGNLMYDMALSRDIKEDMCEYNS